MKRDPRKTLRNKLDKLFSKYIRVRAHFTCQRCGAKHAENSCGLHCHHIVGRGKGYSTRWLSSNGISLCYGCHRFCQHNRDENKKLAKINCVSLDWLEKVGRGVSGADLEELQRLSVVLSEAIENLSEG